MRWPHEQLDLGELCALRLPAEYPARQAAGERKSNVQVGGIMSRKRRSWRLDHHVRSAIERCCPRLKLYNAAVAISGGADGTVQGLGTILRGEPFVFPSPGSPIIRSPTEENERYDGVFWRWDPATGDVSASTFADAPGGFVDAGHFSTYAEDDATGLILIRIWRAPPPCPGR